MSSVFYSKVVPDIGDAFSPPETQTDHPGHLVEVHEKDGAITLFLYEKADSKSKPHAAFFNVAEAEELMKDLEGAVSRARSKNADHPDRVRNSV